MTMPAFRQDPFSFLPVEILQFIIRWAVQLARTDEVLSSFRVMLSLSQIDRYTRAATLADASLWASHVLLSPRLPLEAMETSIRRCKDCPTHLTVETKVSGETTAYLSRSNLDNLIGMMRAGRWTSIQIVGGGLEGNWKSCTALIEELEKVETSMMTSLDVEGFFGAKPPCNAVVADSLTRIKLRGYIFNLSNWPKYPNLRVLDLAVLHCNTESLFELLSNMPCLEALSLFTTPTSSHVQPRQASPDLALPRLRSLSFTGRHLDLGQTLLQMLDAPLLTSITIGNGNHTYQNLIVPPGCTYGGKAGRLLSRVKEFGWRGAMGADYTRGGMGQRLLLEDALTRLGCVVKLKVDDRSSLSLNVLCDLVRDSGSEVLNRMEEVELAEGTGDMLKVRTFVWSRFNIGLAPLRRLSMYVVAPRNEDIEGRLRMWVELKNDIQWLQAHVDKLELRGDGAKAFA